MSVSNSADFSSKPYLTTSSFVPSPSKKKSKTLKAFQETKKYPVASSSIPQERSPFFCPIPNLFCRIEKTSQAIRNQIILIENFLHFRGIDRQIKRKLSAAYTQRICHNNTFTDQEKLICLSLLPFWLDQSKAVQFDAIIDSVENLFEKTIGWIKENLQGDIEQKREFLLRTFSQMLFTQTGQFNVGGVLVVKTLVKGVFALHFQQGHLDQILGVMQHLETNKNLQHLLEERRTRLAPSMRHFIAKELGFDDPMQMHATHLRWACLYMLLFDLRQKQNAPNCLLIAVYRYAIHNHPDRVLELFFQLLHEGSFSIGGKTFHIPTILPEDHLGLPHSSVLQDLMLSISQLVSSNFENPHLRQSARITFLESFFHDLYLALIDALPKTSNSLHFLYQLEANLYETIWLESSERPICKEQVLKSWIKAGNASDPHDPKTLDKLSMLEHLLNSAYRYLFIFNEEVVRVVTIRDFQIQLSKIIAATFSSLYQADPSQRSELLQIAEKTRAFVKSKKFTRLLIKVVSKNHRKKKLHLNSKDLLPLQEIALFNNGYYSTDTESFLLGKMLQSYSFDIQSPEKIPLKIFRNIARLCLHKEIDLREGSLLLVQDRQHVFTLTPSRFREFLETDDIQSALDHYIYVRGKALADIEDPELCCEIIFLKDYFHQIIELLPVKGSDYESIERMLSKKLVLSAWGFFTPYQYARYLQKSIFTITNQLIPLFKLENVIRDALKLPRIIDLGDLNWHDGSAGKRHIRLILKFDYPSQAIAFYQRTHDQDTPCSATRVKELLKLEMLIPKDMVEI